MAEFASSRGVEEGAGLAIFPVVAHVVLELAVVPKKTDGRWDAIVVFRFGLRLPSGLFAGGGRRDPGGSSTRGACLPATSGQLTHQFGVAWPLGIVIMNAFVTKFACTGGEKLRQSSPEELGPRVGPGETAAAVRAGLPEATCEGFARRFDRA